MKTKEQKQSGYSPATGSVLERRVEAIHNYLVKLSDWLEENVSPPGGETGGTKPSPKYP
jgi:hypothetical protein